MTCEQNRLSVEVIFPVDERILSTSHNNADVGLGIIPTCRGKDMRVSCKTMRLSDMEIIRLVDEKICGCFSNKFGYWTWKNSDQYANGSRTHAADKSMRNKSMCNKSMSDMDLLRLVEGKLFE